MDSFTSLTSFVRTAETLSFVQAARLLGISASAVGKNVARLEQKLGVRLFNRSTRSVSLTAEGAVLLVRCQHILEQLQEAEAELTSSIGQPAGKLRVSLPVIGYRLLLPLLPAFTRQYPQIELDLDFSDRLVNIIDEGFDVVIRSGDLADSRLTSKTLGSFNFVLCASPAYLKEYGTPGAEEDLSAHQCVLSASLDGSNTAVGAAGITVTGDFACASALTANNIEAVIGISAAGMGISYVPDFVVRDALEKGDLSEVLPGSCVRQGHFVHYGPPDATSLREYAALSISSPKTGRSDPAFNRSARPVAPDIQVFAIGALRSGRQITARATLLHMETAPAAARIDGPRGGMSASSSSGPNSTLPASTAKPPAVASAP